MRIVIFFFALLSTVVCAQQIDVVLVGATGNLAQKYLWTSLFRLSSDLSLRVYPGAREKQLQGQQNINQIIAHNISCSDRSNAPTSCSEQLTAFSAKNVNEYTQLKTADHYAKLDAVIESFLGDSGEPAGRLFYLAVPPKAYGLIARFINEHARPEKGWLRVIFEKPFGSDLESARVMAAELSAQLSEEEIYRIDHYLGKEALQALPEFLATNAKLLDPVMNSRHVAQIDVAMMETEDCEGRTGFYDKYGVLRDVFQNHLSEMLALILASCPRDAAGVCTGSPVMPKERLEALIRMLPPSPKETSIGQYLEYQEHVDADRRRWDEPIGKQTLTPTCALVRMQATAPRWRDVPIYLYSGKKAWTKKSGIVRVAFQNGGWLQVTLQGSHGAGKIEFQNLPLQSSTSLAGPTGWVPLPKGFQVPVKRNAYDVLVEAALYGQTQHFVSTDRLMRSWQLWTPLLAILQNSEPTLYVTSNASSVCHPPKPFRMAEEL